MYNHIESVVFGGSPQLNKICQNAFARCEFLGGISIPLAIEIIEESAFGGCSELEYCEIHENAKLVRIERGHSPSVSCSDHLMSREGLR
jgi:hypothetical protein